jgi:predicted NodU family carbamoyl transferase
VSAARRLYAIGESSVYRALDLIVPIMLDVRSFRPFAPSVLEEAVAEWFEEDDAVPAMMQLFQNRKEKVQ